MQNLPSTFHNFLCYDDLPGILIPQKVYLDPTLHQKSKDVRTFATFYRHETRGATLSAGPGATLGVSLAQAFAFNSEVMREARGCRDTTLAPLDTLRLKFVLEWPGCTDYVPAYTRHGGDRCVWTAARLAYEVARTVHNFYEMFENYLDMRRPADDWTPDRIPFDKLYLLELRQVSTRVLQPVLYYDAD